MFSLALSNLYAAFFPERIVLTGPFVQQQKIISTIEAGFSERVPAYARGRFSLRAARPGTGDEIVGAALPLLERALRRLLTARETGPG